MFHPAVRSWFEAVFPQSTRPQLDGWPIIARGDSALILAPMGTGKTLAAFLWCINLLLTSNAREAIRSIDVVIIDEITRCSRQTRLPRPANFCWQTLPRPPMEWLPIRVCEKRQGFANRGNAYGFMDGLVNPAESVENGFNRASKAQMPARRSGAHVASRLRNKRKTEQPLAQSKVSLAWSHISHRTRTE